MKKSGLSVLLCVLVGIFNLGAEAPAGYYKAAEGKTGQALLQALGSIVGSHTTVSYDGLWEVYNTSDLAEDGSGLWDMYSTKIWPIGKERCGNYTYVGDCVNREHSMPKSWFSNASPMYSDAFHLYPTDGKVNGQRSNFPYGECSGGTKLASSNGVEALGKLGSSTFSGYSGKVFEPDDRYKGDFARSYFYMAAAYNSRIAGWNSDMLAGNSYPAFSSWALNLLLKWHRQDAVSKKETVRNDAVYAHQKNRNPFIDYPELVEYVWGNKAGTPWYPNGAVEPEIVSPANGSVIEMGYASVGVTKSMTVKVAGVSLTDNVSITSDNPEFTVSPSLFAASAVNNGTNVTVSLNSSATGLRTATLTFRSGSSVSKVALRATAVDGLVAEEASVVTTSSFVARWVNVSGEDAVYKLYVERGGEILNGYPIEVPAKDGFRRIDGVEAETTYVYYLTEGSRMSNRITVTTPAPVPMIQLLYAGETVIRTSEGNPSAPLELFFETENITGDIVASVATPFELSSDKNKWGQTLNLSTEEDHFFLRVGVAGKGEYSSVLSMSSGDYVYDDVEFEAVVGERQAPFFEDFETGDNCKDNYTNGDYQGNAVLWYCDNVGVYKGDVEKALNGERSARFGKNTNSTLVMKEDRNNGVGKVTFNTQKWGGDADAVLNVEYSLDGGNTWVEAGKATVEADVRSHSVEVNQPGTVRVRFRQTSGSRLFLDDIAMEDYSAGIEAVSADSELTWTAFCISGEIVMENGGETSLFEVYSVDGTEIARFVLSSGTKSIRLASGLYIVVSGDSARKVLVR